jgi:hypothetical protein
LAAAAAAAAPDITVTAVPDPMATVEAVPLVFATTLHYLRTVEDIMKLAIQVINHNQREHIEPMLNAIKHIGADRFWGLDRCTDGSKELLLSLGETDPYRIVENNEGKGFLAGRMRDMVLDRILAYPYDAVLMLDGDRYPVGLTEAALGRDENLFDVSLYLSNQLMPPDARYVRDRAIAGEYTEGYLGVITAGLWVRRTFIDRVRALKVMNGRCFHKTCDGVWGWEDTIFGAALYALGANIGYSKTIRVSGDLSWTGKVLSPEELELSSRAQKIIGKLVVEDHHPWL